MSGLMGKDITKTSMQQLLYGGMPIISGNPGEEGNKNAIIKEAVKAKKDAYNKALEKANIKLEKNIKLDKEKLEKYALEKFIEEEEKQQFMYGEMPRISESPEKEAVKAKKDDYDRTLEKANKYLRIMKELEKEKNSNKVGKNKVSNKKNNEKPELKLSRDYKKEKVDELYRQKGDLNNFYLSYFENCLNEITKIEKNINIIKEKNNNIKSLEKAANSFYGKAKEEILKDAENFKERANVDLEYLLKIIQEYKEDLKKLNEKREQILKLLNKYNGDSKKVNIIKRIYALNKELSEIYDELNNKYNGISDEADLEVSLINELEENFKKKFERMQRELEELLKELEERRKAVDEINKDRDYFNKLFKIYSEYAINFKEFFVTIKTTCAIRFKKIEEAIKMYNGSKRENKIKDDAENFKKKVNASMDELSNANEKFKKDLEKFKIKKEKFLELLNKYNNNISKRNINEEINIINKIRELYKELEEMTKELKNDYVNINNINDNKFPLIDELFDKFTQKWSSSFEKMPMDKELKKRKIVVDDLYEEKDDIDKFYSKFSEKCLKDLKEIKSYVDETTKRIKRYANSFEDAANSTKFEGEDKKEILEDAKIFRGRVNSVVNNLVTTSEAYKQCGKDFLIKKSRFLKLLNNYNSSVTEKGIINGIYELKKELDAILSNLTQKSINYVKDKQVPIIERLKEETINKKWNIEL